MEIRTNNHCEGWHTRFANAIGRHHPNIYQVVKCIQDKQASVTVLHQQIAAGRLARRHVPKYVELEKRLQKLQTRYERGRITALEYVTGVSHNLAERI